MTWNGTASNFRHGVVWLAVWAAVCGAGRLSADEPQADANAEVDYVRDVKPLLQTKCFACHGPLEQEGDLRLDTAALIRAGGASGPAIVPGKPSESMLIHKVASQDADLRMPPDGSGSPLSAMQVAVLTNWIAGGAVAPEETPAADPREHWAFRPSATVPVPAAQADWIRNDIDRFIAAEHARVGVEAVGEAEPEVLLRRVYLDLIGLPPPREQLQAFLRDPTPKAYQRVVDDLLASPRYGERWARHWMDVWRYSDPSGYGEEIRDSREHIWRWRDWIIESLNADKGYDRMVIEMLAADEAAPADPGAARATGFLARNWYKFNRNVWLDNIVEHSSKAFLGITLNCARCHDHKYDPLAQPEYYRMRAVFETHDVRDDPVGDANEPLLVRAYDAHPDRPTYLFEQGDEKRPLDDQPLAPGVPEVLGGPLDIRPVELPVQAWYPSLRAEIREARLREARDRVEAARREADALRRKADAARGALADAPVGSEESGSEGRPASGEPAPEEPGGEVLAQDDFHRLDEARWQAESGTWSVEEGRVRQTDGKSVQHRLVSRFEHPRDFRLRTRLRITGGEQYRSVGVGFDVQERQMRAVYLSAGASKAQVTLQDAEGSWAYPARGAASHPIRLGQDYELELAVRDRLVNVLLDGQLLLTFPLPSDREPGRLALWTFSAAAEFDQLVLEELADGAALAESLPADSSDPPAAEGDLAAAASQAELSAEVAALHLATQEAELASLLARTDAECAKYGLESRDGTSGDTEQLARQASRAERTAAVRKLEEQLARDRHDIAAREKAAAEGDAKAQPALDKARKDLAVHAEQLAAAQGKLAADSTEYAPLGPQYPRTSSGRRLAYARWLTSPQNPLTARVAVNHIWMRHFDAPLVDRVFDFGLRSESPRFANLLDWLAVRFMEDGWSMKRLHRRIVTSGVYRRGSSAADGDPDTRRLDPDNHALWHMNPRRMEAEVVRDSLLHLGESLEETIGGPPIDYQQGQSVPRRSIYFRQDKERQMTFLSLFDGAKVNECYRRKATVAPQQALAMFNSQVAWNQAQKLAARWSELTDQAFVETMFEHVLCRTPSLVEQQECLGFLEDLPDASRARRQLALVLLNHHDFVTIR